MYYSAVAFIALTVNFILNWKSIKLVSAKSDVQNEEHRVKVRYAHFLLATSFFFLIEISWGLLYGNRDIPELFPIIYSITIFYYIAILLTMLTWARYIVVYLDNGVMSSRAMTFVAWAVFIVGMVCLAFNRYYPFIFSYNDAHEYIPESGRYTFGFVFVFYAAIAVSMAIAARSKSPRTRIRYMTVAYTSISFGLFIFLQILFSFYPLYVVGLLIGICVIRSYVEEGAKQEKEIQDRIAHVMAEDYVAIYYIDLETGEYLEYAGRQKDFMNMPSSGKDFYMAFKANIALNAYSDDRDSAENSFTKETMINNLEGRRSFSCKYRFMVDGLPRFFLITYMRAGSDKNHMILYEKDINDELVAEKKRKESQKKTVTFTQIAESLASNYDELYYVDMTDDSYTGFVFNNIYGSLEIRQSGDDFYSESAANIPHIVQKQDQEMILDFINKDNLISALEARKARTVDYRITVSGKSRYVRMTVRKTSDGTHFIIGVENIDDEINREKQHLKALKTEKELARRDELTGTKNKNAYKELEASVQANIDNDMDYLPFALVVCDANNLKVINDTLGHAAGDEYIKASAKLLCDIFVHSPVFRIGGDEFVVFLRGDDYSAKDELMVRLRSQVIENQKTGIGTVLASGISEYDPKNDSFVSDVFERADKEMYENKQKLKSMDKKVNS